jgi:hypothetical protein
MRVRVYNIWHNKLFSQLYEELPKEEFPNLVMFGVNEKYEKLYDSSLPYNIEYEYNLPYYNPKLQQHGYCQTTCMYHIFKTGSYKDLDYIGFIQYDMKVGSNFFQEIRDLGSKGQEVIFHEQTEHIYQSAHWAQGLMHPYPGSALEHYNKHFGTNITLQEIARNEHCHKVPLVHTFVIPVRMFEKMMSWICEYVDYLESIHPTYPSNVSQSELLERCHGMFLALERMLNPGILMYPMNVKHIWPLYHDMTDYKNYKTIV